MTGSETLASVKIGLKVLTRIPVVFLTRKMLFPGAKKTNGWNFSLRSTVNNKTIVEGMREKN